MMVHIRNIPVDKWAADAMNGVWFGVGFGHTDVKPHEDFIMCEYYLSPPESGPDTYCYDRHWDHENFYEDDTRMDNSFKLSESKRMNEDGSMDLAISVAKYYKARLGSHDYEIKDGEEVEVVWVYGDIKYGSPVFKKDKYVRKQFHLFLDNVEEERKKHSEL